jgi:hypothetical protein
VEYTKCSYKLSKLYLSVWIIAKLLSKDHRTFKSVSATCAFKFSTQWRVWTRSATNKFDRWFSPPAAQLGPVNISLPVVHSRSISTYRVRTVPLSCLLPKLKPVYLGEIAGLLRTGLKWKRQDVGKVCIRKVFHFLRKKVDMSDWRLLKHSLWLIGCRCSFVFGRSWD